ncbi:hypothetical protein OUZ56_018440 [Daphnia magna]|uniref:RING-type domain-containing protein n=1 Tax=Daphnia magna TaxID=35525 RepID=A0ABQ9Z8W3_9CRUS|nr:hypothetical protein OUZ56_018440 [Daphnia magna]
MTNKIQTLCECCLRRLLEICQQNTGRVPEPTLLISDYELAILQSMSAVFLTGRARGCYFHSGMLYVIASSRCKYHYIMGIYLNLSNNNKMYACYLGLGQAYRTNDQINRLELRSYANEIGGAIDAESRVRVNQFVQYIRSFWMECIGPERFCVNMENNRTNNQMEANHRSFNHNIGNPHPNPWYFLDRLQEFGQEAEYSFLALRDGTPVRDRRRQKYVTRDREIRTLQIDLQNGRITIREFLMAAAFHFEPVEIEFREQNAEELNRPFDEVQDEIVEIEVVLAAENRLEIAAVEDPGAPVARGRGRGRPHGRRRPQVRGAPRREANEQIAVVDPPAVNRRGRRGRPRGHQGRAPAPRQGALVEVGPIGNPAALLNERGGAGRGRRYVRRVAPADPHLESEDSQDEDNAVRMERFFEAQNANFLQRRANVMARLLQLRQEREIGAAQQIEEINEELLVADVLQHQRNILPQFPEINHDGNCPVCWLRMPNTVLNCGHIFCLECIEIIEASGIRTCSVCLSAFDTHRPLLPNDVNVANILLEFGNQH